MFPYEQLTVYKLAYGVNKKIYRLIKANAVIPSYAKNQFGRASLSIMLNNAEGSAKFSNKDRRRFLVIARSSVFECVSLSNFLCDEGEITINEWRDFNASFESISRMLYTMIKNLDQ